MPKRNRRSSFSESESSLDRKIRRFVKNEIKSAKFNLTKRNKKRHRHRRYTSSESSDSYSSNGRRYLSRSRSRSRSRSMESSKAPDEKGHKSNERSENDSSPALPFHTDSSIQQNTQAAVVMAAPVTIDTVAAVAENTTSENNNDAQGKEISSPALNDDVLKVIGGRYLRERKLSQPICAHVALRWEDIAKQGLPVKDRTEIMEKYNPPENCLFIDPPKLNADIKDSLQLSVRKRDERILEKQQKITACMGATSSILNDLLKEEAVNLKLIELASDIGSLLMDLQYDENNIRKTLIMANLNKNIKETLQESTPDGFLFGKDLEERMKARELIERSSRKLRSTKSDARPYSSSKNLKTPSRSKTMKAMPPSGRRRSASRIRQQANHRQRSRDGPYQQRQTPRKRR